MKEDVFNQYVEKVLDLFNMDRETLFSRTKKRHIVDARQLLYYLCYNRKIQCVTIKDFMLENGASIHHNSIANGIKNVKLKFEEDRDYKAIIKELEKSVFI
jgi:chromosomal replication initiation ATPase DnaA